MMLFFFVKLLVVLVYCCSHFLRVLSLKEFSLARYNNTAVYPNNSVINIHLVGEGFEGLLQITEGGALECHTDDTTCCRGIDNPPNGTGRGEWYYPDGTVVPPPGGARFYRTRDHMGIRLNRDGVARPTGVYRCEIPGAGGVTIIRFITLIFGTCSTLNVNRSGSITYTPPHEVSAALPAGQRYIGTIATYGCSPGHQLVGGSSLRACGPDGTWNGTKPSCEVEPPSSTIISSTAISTNVPTSTINPAVTDCGPLTDPTNGQVDTSPGTTFGSVAAFSCNTGYRLSHPQVVMCGADGMWSPASPSCLGFPTSCDSSYTFTDNNGVVGGVTAAVLITISMVIIALLIGYNIHLRRQLKQQQCKEETPVELQQYETVGGGSAPQYEVTERAGVEYEEIDRLRETREQPHPPTGDYELTQCPAYGPVNRDTT